MLDVGESLRVLQRVARYEVSVPGWEPTVGVPAGPPGRETPEAAPSISSFNMAGAAVSAVPDLRAADLLRRRQRSVAPGPR
jgi:hypothetical protein